MIFLFESGLCLLGLHEAPLELVAPQFFVSSLLVLLVDPAEIVEPFALLDTVFVLVV